MGKKERLVFMFDTGPVIIFRLNDAGILVAMSRDHEVRMRHLLHRYLEKMEYIPDDEMVEVTSSSGRTVVAHAATVEGMRRSIIAGVKTIEHGDDGTPEIFKLMKDNDVALCPTLSAGHAIAQYRGWRKGTPEPESVKKKRKSFADALQAGVKICMGGDVGVFTHGDNAREMEMMVEYGMQPIEVLKSATSVNADVFNIHKTVGRISAGLFADILIVKGDPSKNINDVRKVQMVMKNGIVYKNNF